MEKILIIEDNAMMRLFLTNYLSNQYEVVAAKNPQEGLTLLKRHSNEYALVLSDYYSPASTESAAVAQIRELLKWQNTPFIILTDQDKSDQRIEAFKAGANDCLSKPFNPVELNLRIQGLVGMGKQQAVYRPVA